jgi:hypothetical protein
VAIWTDAYIERKGQEAEEEISKALGCIVDRVVLSLASGQEEYEMPSGTLSVRQITWKGKLLFPYTFNEMKGIYYQKPSEEGAFEDDGYVTTGYSAEDNQNSQGEPLYYVYDTMGYNKITFYPCPSTSLGAPADGTDLWSPAVIDDYCIVEYTRLPDTAGNTHRVPTYLRRRLVKEWVLWKAFGMEGKGQDLEASEYYRQKYERGLIRAKGIIRSITHINSRMHNLDNSGNAFSVYLAPPRFPDNYPSRW